MLALIIMGIVQGLTEFLPVSSSGHLLFIQSIFKIKDINLPIDIFLHLATFLIIIIYFFKDIINIVRNVLSGPFDFKNPDTRIFYMIVLTSIPTAIIGFILSNECFSFIFMEGNILFATWTLTAVLLIFSDRIKSDNLSLNRITPLYAILIGVAQGMAVLPGISRSGITIIAALFLGINRKDSFRYSFLAGLPAMLGAFLLEFESVGQINIPVRNMILIFVITLLAGLVGIVLLLKLLNSKKFKYFGFYLILMILILGLKVFLER